MICRPRADGSHDAVPPEVNFDFIQIFAACEPSFHFTAFHAPHKNTTSPDGLTVGVCLIHVAMESLGDTLWDVVICGTGLQQSLLAL